MLDSIAMTTPTFFETWTNIFVIWCRDGSWKILSCQAMHPRARFILAGNRYGLHCSFQGRNVTTLPGDKKEDGRIAISLLKFDLNNFAVTERMDENMSNVTVWYCDNCPRRHQQNAVSLKIDPSMSPVFFSFHKLYVRVSYLCYLIREIAYQLIVFLTSCVWRKRQTNSWREVNLRRLLPVNTTHVSSCTKYSAQQFIFKIQIEINQDTFYFLNTKSV